MILSSENDIFESIEVLINDTIKKLVRKNFLNILKRLIS